MTIELKDARLCMNCNLIHTGWTCPKCGESGTSYWLQPWLDGTVKKWEERGTV